MRGLTECVLCMQTLCRRKAQKIQPVPSGALTLIWYLPSYWLEMVNLPFTHPLCHTERSVKVRKQNVN